MNTFGVGLLDSDLRVASKLTAIPDHTKLLSVTAAKFRQTLAKIAPVVVVFCILILFSACHAQRTCNAIVRDELPPPWYSTRFALRPNRHIDGIAEVGFKPGWIISYVTRTKAHGMAFHVTLFGRVEASGTPRVVTAYRREAEKALEKFRRDFAARDAAIPVGSSFSNAMAFLGEPLHMTTNNDGSWSASFDYMPPLVSIPIDWLTNGFTLWVSNNIIIAKGYSYTASR